MAVFFINMNIGINGRIYTPGGTGITLFGWRSPMPLASSVSGEVLHYPPLKELISNLNLVTPQHHGQAKGRGL